MIIFGISASERRGAAIQSPCNYCGESAVVCIRSFRYFHLFFLPVLPLWGRRGVTCTHCLQTRWDKDLDVSIKVDPAFAERLPRRPRWHFIGLALISLLIATLVFSGETDREVSSATAAATPSVGDVWIVNLEKVVPDAEVELNFAVARVDIVADDKVFLGFSDWQYESWFMAYRKAKGAAKAMDPEYFTSTGLWFSVDDIINFESIGDLTLAVTAHDLE